MMSSGTSMAPQDPSAAGSRSRAARPVEELRADGYPISRRYLRPAAGWLARRLAASPVRPVHLTLCGLALGAAAAAVLLLRPEGAPLAAVLVLAAWFFDRADGQLARLQGTASAWGAWLDGNVDELLDVAWHVALAAALAMQTASMGPWLLLVAFLAGKYLFMHGLMTEESTSRPAPLPGPCRRGWLHAVYHFPGNADFRVHLLAAALVTGWLTTELAIVAGYYNLRWIIRYGLVARRLGVGTDAGAAGQTDRHGTKPGGRAPVRRSRLPSSARQEPCKPRRP
jgi:phosphatidylglycerophosphate synthase